MKVLITGVAGLVGSHFARHLLEKEHEVIGVDNLMGGYSDFIDERVKFHMSDLVDWRQVEKIFDIEQPDTVCHFAAYAAEGLSPFIRRFNYMNNVVVSANVINACLNHGVKKLIFTSSMSVYGKGEPPFTENDQLMPIDPYGIAKYTVEQDIRTAGEQFGLKYSIVRPHNIIGIYQNIWDRYRNVIGIWIRQCLEGKNITVFGNGEQTRAFSDIKFYMEPMERLLTEYNGAVFNLGADKEYKIIDAARIVQSVARERGYKTGIEFLEGRHEVKHAYCDHSRAKKALGFIDGTVLEDTIEEMFDWAVDQPPREIKQMKYEVERGIYSFWKEPCHST